ncbi:putative major facilitator superfamily general substrate transporter [Rosellinia necatrix]|uniref:Putative major facilitator superfamily general substrate transporter n=1 Tax=Rosellinia necatrix TaxID=77044 RepID=A0A1W2TR63_ROSNE|nr:putative major facilitator superfamily general substrate transporter [Rosellinia necatrix]
MGTQDITTTSGPGRMTNVGFKGDNEDSEACRTSVEKDGLDSNIVDWDGPDDPGNPRQWSQAKKNFHIVIVSIFALIGNLASTMFAPGAAQLAQDFHITNTVIQTFTVNIYLLAFAVGPLFLAPLSEIYGRLIIYHVCNVLYIAFIIGCAFSTNVSMFLVFRVFSGLVASGPLTIGGGTIADVTSQHERGKAIALWGIGPLVGPVVGPIIGGFVTQDVGWRWTFRILIILSVVQAVATLLFMRETSATIILQRKTARLIKETGNTKLVPKSSTDESPRQIFFRSIVRPAKMIVFSPIVLLLSLYVGTLYGIIFLLFATFTMVFHETYNFDTGISGLAYLGLGLGFVFALFVFSLFSDRLMGQGKDGNGAEPERRLILMKWIAPIAPLGCFLYGWTAEYRVHWIVPILGTFIVGFGSLFVVIPAQTYLVDAFGSEASASALAANLIIRAPFGALLALAAPPLYARLGLGWGNSVLGFVALAFTPVPWLFYRYGATLRNRFPIKL